MHEVSNFGGLASQPTLSRCTAMLAEPGNLKVLREAALELAGRNLRAENGGQRRTRMTLDVDSLPIEVHGHQPKAEWNGHYRTRIYHPLVTSIAETGDMLDAGCAPAMSAQPRAPWTSSSTSSIEPRPVCARSPPCASMRAFPPARSSPAWRSAASTTSPRLRANAALDRLAAPHMKRPPGRRPTEPRLWTHELDYQAQGWDEPRRVVLVVKEREGDLLLDRFFLVTSISRFQMDGQALLDHYRQRGQSRKATWES